MSNKPQSLWYEFVERGKSDYNLVYQSNEQEMKPLLEKSKGLIARINAYIAG